MIAFLSGCWRLPPELWLDDVRPTRHNLDPLSPRSPIEFFDEPKIVSLRKLDLFVKYLTPWTYKLGSGWRNIWVVDGFAGAGAYQPDGGGRIQPGSPFIAAKWAAEQARLRKHLLLRCINTEADPTCFEELCRTLAPWQHVVSNRPGEFSTNLDWILKTIGRDPAFFFLDPFGVSGIEMALIERILEYGGRHNELLIHFSERSFRRMAGHVNDRDRLPVGAKMAATKVRRLDAVIGTTMWQGWWGGEVDLNTAFDKTVEIYLAQLRQRGFDHADQIRMRNHWSDSTRYRLVFATRSPHGITLMSDIACRYERGLHDEHLAGQGSLLADLEERERSATLREDIHRAGIQLGADATPQKIAHRLVPQRFGQFTSTDYNRAIRELVKLGLIDRATSTGIKETESLRFVEPAQGSLLSG